MIIRGSRPPAARCVDWTHCPFLTWDPTIKFQEHFRKYFRCTRTLQRITSPLHDVSTVPNTASSPGPVEGGLPLQFLLSYDDVSLKANKSNGNSTEMARMAENPESKEKQNNWWRRHWNWIEMLALLIINLCVINSAHPPFSTQHQPPPLHLLKS